ncbi:MAG: drug/metabolite transporter (DMT)-like permease [Gammaproteobacteria bacterium]
MQLASARSVQLSKTLSDSGRSNQALAGIACLCIGVFFFSVQDAMVKQLLSTYSVLQILLVRAAVAGAALGGFILWRRGVAGLRTALPRLHALRCAFVFFAFTSFYTAVGLLPLADVVALFGAAPIIITALSRPVLGEQVDARRWCAVVVGFIGVVIMVKPGAEVFNPAALFGVFAACCYAGSAITVRYMGSKEAPSQLAFFSNMTFIIGCGIGLTVISMSVDPQLDPSTLSPLLRPYAPAARTDLMLMVAAGLVTISGFVLVPRAYQLAPVSVVSPFEYTYLLWALLFGFFVFGELPGVTTAVGAALVVAASVYIARRETASL